MTSGLEKSLNPGELKLNFNSFFGFHSKKLAGLKMCYVALPESFHIQVLKNDFLG